MHGQALAGADWPAYTCQVDNPHVGTAFPFLVLPGGSEGLGFSSE